MRTYTGPRPPENGCTGAHVWILALLIKQINVCNRVCTGSGPVRTGWEPVHTLLHTFMLVISHHFLGTCAPVHRFSGMEG